MITINATGDTTLHTAGKYCPEDILVKVPSGGGSGSGSVETCTVGIIPGTPSSGRFVTYMTVDESGNIVSKLLTDFDATTTITCVCDSIVSLSYPTDISAFSCMCQGCELVTQHAYGLAVKLIAESGASAYIRVLAV